MELCLDAVLRKPEYVSRAKKLPQHMRDKIKRAHKEGMSLNQIARTFQYNRETISRIVYDTYKGEQNNEDC